MTASFIAESGTAPVSEPIAVIRARALADVRSLLRLARQARIDGLPKPELRAANARAAARRVIAYARRLSTIVPHPVDGSCPAELAE